MVVDKSVILELGNTELDVRYDPKGWYNESALDANR